MTDTPTPSPGGLYAALTGDLIGSTKLTPAELARARDTVLEAAERFRARSRRAIAAPPEFFRGDAWQLLLGEPALALRVALYIRALLKAALDVETRISIGIGTVDNLNRRRVSLSTGEAFTLSGRALDAITGYFDLTGAIPARAGPLAAWFPATLHLCSGLLRPWTQRQAEIVSLALLLDTTHERIAESLKPSVSKQTVSESLAGANWRTLEEALAVFEETQWPNILASQGAP